MIHNSFIQINCIYKKMKIKVYELLILAHLFVT